MALPSSKDKAGYVHTLFSAVAKRYDLLNRILSFGIDKYWRKQAVQKACETSPNRILDVATGTADLAISLKKNLPHSEVVGIDFVESMLEIGRKKVDRLALDISLEQGNGQNLAFEDATFDLVSIAYGIRNFADCKQGLAEFYRVLKPGGRLIILEFPPPPRTFFGRLFRMYFLGVTPYIAGLISGQRDAYVYLGQSVLKFPPPDALAVMMQEAGFMNVSYQLQTFGVSALHVGEKH